MKTAVKYGAQFERDNKTYQNRTWKLLRNTKGRIDRASNNEVVAEIVMDMPYASHVNKLGYSAIDEAAAATKLAIQDIIDGLTK